MEKLIVKNFGPIKDVELDIKKINILIGEQGSGKSTLAKLLAIFRDEHLFIGDFYENFTDLLDEFQIAEYFNEFSSFLYSNQNYILEIKNINSYVKFYNNELKNLINNYINNISGSEDKIDIQLRKELLNTISTVANNIVYYIPTERNLIPMISNSSFSFTKNNIDIPVYLQDFGSDYQICKNDFKGLKLEVLDAFLSIENGIEFINTSHYRIALTKASSGFQSSIPLFMIIEGFYNPIKDDNYRKGNFIIEEPEINLFPVTQNKLVKYLIIKCPLHDDNLFITTHSPYILSSLNNLMYAYNVGQKNEKASEIIHKKYWVNPADVSAYMLYADGRYENIMDMELNQIDVSKIDSVSKEINEEYDKILNLEFDNV